MKRISVVVSLALLMSACNGGSRFSTPTTPSLPTTPPTPTPQVTYALSGVVSEETESGLAPVEGVLVEACNELIGFGCGTNPIQSATTDQGGVYTISGLYAGQSLVWATKDGYQNSVPYWPLCEGSGCGNVMVDGDTRFDIALER